MTTVPELEAVFGRRWSFMDGAGGGVIAVRRGKISLSARRRGLAYLVCGEPDQVREGLAEQYRLEGLAIPQ